MEKNIDICIKLQQCLILELIMWVRVRLSGIMICECVFFGSSCLESSLISFLLNHFHKLDSKFEHQMEKNK